MGLPRASTQVSTLVVRRPASGRSLDRYRFLGCTGRMQEGANDGGMNEQLFQVCVPLERFGDAAPDTICVAIQEQFILFTTHGPFSVWTSRLYRLILRMCCNLITPSAA